MFLLLINIPCLTPPICKKHFSEILPGQTFPTESINCAGLPGLRNNSNIRVITNIPITATKRNIPIFMIVLTMKSL
jgi:hypothetical protein